MAHSSFIDCEVGNGLSESFISEADLKVEIEAQQVNDDENVAVEVLGQLGGNYESASDEIPTIIPIKAEENSFTYVHEVHVEEGCIVENETVQHIIPDIIDGNDHTVKGENTMIINNDNTSGMVNNGDNIIDHGNDDNIFNNEVHDYLINCATCGLKFQSEFDLQNHVVLVHNNTPSNRPYKCGSCAMSFQRKSSWKNHSKIHSYGTPLYKDDDNDCALGIKNEKHKTDNRKRNKKGTINVKKINTMQDHRIPPFETIKANAVSPNANYSLDNNVNLFDGWSLNDGKSENDVNVSSDGIQPIMEVSNLPVINHTSYDLKQENISFNNDDDDVNSKINLSMSMNLNQHSESKEKPYSCPFCHRSFAREKALLNHIRIHNDNYDMTLECQKCHDVFDDIISLQAHLVACVLPESAVVDHHPPPPESPEYVPYEHKRYNFNNNNNVSTSENTTVGDHVCDICNKRFKTRQKVFRHMWVHRKKVYTCEVCGLAFPGIKYLDEHRLALHPSKAPFACVTCGKSFMSKQGLTEHSRLHKGWSDQYYCNHCNKFFSSRQGFTIHGRIHTGERPYGCKYCPKSFRDGGTLKKHERIHTGERPHECPLCHKRYNQKVVLREHIRGVHVMKKNSEIHGKCPVCDLCNLEKEELSEHIVRHSDELMKKNKQEYVLKQKSMNCFNKPQFIDKVDKFSKKRRYRLKKVTVNERVNDKSFESISKMEEENIGNDDQDSNYGYLSNNKVPLRQPKKRTGARKRILNKKSTVNKINQRKKADSRYETRKAKRVLKCSPKRNSSSSNSYNHNSIKQELSYTNDTEPITNLQETSPSVDDVGSENSSNHFESDYNKCLVDFSEEYQKIKSIECEMCHARFPTRSELITHILVHI